MYTKLSVNVNKIALLRNSRGAEIPSVVRFAKNAERYGAEGITIHPRPDERHIRRHDVSDLSTIYPTTNCEFNIEGYPTKEFIQLVLNNQPTQCTLVPDDPNQLTSDHGWDTIKHEAFLTEVVGELKAANIRVALFIDPENALLDGAKKVGADRIEFYTGPYASNYAKNKEMAIQPFAGAALHCNQIKLGINAGHDLNLDNLAYLKQHIPNLLEVSIGHAFVRDCLYFGLENTVNLYKRCLN